MTIKGLLALGIAGVALGANAITVDGIATAGDGYTNSFTVNWYNDHNGDDTAYGMDQGLSTDVFWAVSGGDFYMYVAVPLYAKNMMWGDALLADAAELDAYFYNNTHYHHSLDKVEDKAQFGTMTGSERIEWDSAEIGLDGSPDNGDWDVVATSLDWVLDNGCDTSSCDRKDIPMAFEFRFDNFSDQDIDDLIAVMQSGFVVFHLSDERQGELSLTTVPVPAAAWLFGSALLGLFGVSKKKAA